MESEVTKEGALTQIAYTYNALGYRTSKTVDGVTTEHLLDGANVAADVANGQVTQYVRGLGLTALVQADGTRLQYVTDGHGDVKKLISSSGAVVQDYTYDAFGNQTSETEDSNPFRYAGEYYDAETGLIYLRARYYDSGVGGFISEDPARDGENWYSYCGGNPVMFVDTLGLFRIVDGTAYDRYQLGSGNANNEVNDYVSRDIQKLQMRLQELGYLDSSITAYGYFGAKTLAAVNAFKEDMGLQNDTGATRGVVGVTTWAFLGLDFDVMESDGTLTNLTMGKGVLHVDKNISNANISNLYNVAGAIKDAYKLAFGETFNVSTESVYWELVGHLIPGSIAEANEGGTFEFIWATIRRSTDVIDIGDNIIAADDNRWVWDWMANSF